MLWCALSPGVNAVHPLHDSSFFESGSSNTIASFLASSFGDDVSFRFRETPCIAISKLSRRLPFLGLGSDVRF
jgi:hypothetical protein